MTLLVIENYPKAGMAALGRYASAEGLPARVIRAYAGEPLPDEINGYVGLVVLGGAQSALDDEAYPHLAAVCSLIRRFHETNRPVLGICLGCQLIARTFGGRNILNQPIEFGWHEVTPTPAGLADPVLGALGEGGPLFHWHTDTVSMPDGAEHLATSKMTPVQAFRVGRATYAIQFHFEAALEDVRDWSETFADEILPHTPDWSERLDTDAARHAAKADELGAALAKAWLDLVS
ncbi:type 1 glutamine amidotransferase [Roseibium sp. HPY-6]|uniref:type 1 glutamine amidotransferase n=1 Tax=Roseibium sp. HPY-6 TaxID=3229852 RepID=UPI0033904E34